VAIVVPDGNFKDYIRPNVMQALDWQYKNNPSMKQNVTFKSAAEMLNTYQISNDINGKQTSFDHLIHSVGETQGTSQSTVKKKFETFALEAKMSLEDVDYLCENEFLPVELVLGKKTNCDKGFS
jgi:hypothetical protein